ncbi:Uncharacterised protein [Fusobacterium varium]|nr:Uncharacterised protein [Fusobacterium varium]
MNHLKFFIPLNYSFLTRINKIETKISYIYNYVLPVFILFFIFLILIFIII